MAGECEHESKTPPPHHLDSSSIGRQRGTVLLRPFSDAPAPNRACILSMHTAFQFPEASEDCSPAHHAPTSSLLLSSLSRFPPVHCFPALPGRASLRRVLPRLRDPS